MKKIILSAIGDIDSFSLPLQAVVGGLPEGRKVKV